MDISLMEKCGLDHLIIGKKLYINHKDCSKTLLSKGFKKFRSKKRDKTVEYTRNFGQGRVHIIHNMGGIYWHIDNHN